MKRLLSVLLALSLILASGAALGEGAIAELTKEEIRLTAYLEHLAGRFEDGGTGKIMYVGVADINKDTLPELFYVWRQSTGESWFHFCYYDGSVEEYEYEDNYIGYNPSWITMTRVRKVGTSEHCWVMQSKGKTSNGYNERLVNVFVSAIPTEDTGVRFRRTWKGSKNRYYVDGDETMKIVYNKAFREFKTRLVLASTTRFRNTGAVVKVANRNKWLSVRNAFNTAAVRYMNMR